MKTFLVVAMLSIGSGLAVRFALHRHHDEPKPPPPEVVTAPTPPPIPEPPPPKTEPKAEPKPEPPAPPRVAGSKQIGDATAQWFGVGPGVVYYCDGHSVMAQPKTGGEPQAVGECTNAFDFIADAQGVFFCNDHTVTRITAGTTGNHAVAENVDCIMQGLDAKYAYFSVPGFEGNINPGVYRVVRAGGTPERIYSTRPKEQFGLAVDSDAIWVSAWGAGSIGKLAKAPNASIKQVVTDQPGIVAMGVDPTYVYWHSEQTTEVRRRKRTGGAIEVVGHDVAQEPIATSDGHVYWFEGPPDNTRLVHLAPGSLRVETIAQGLKTPSLRVDSEGEYVTELDQPGIFMFAR